MQIESSPGIGTCVIINIPIRTEAEEAVGNEGLQEGAGIGREAFYGG